ncbi:HAD superfamily phosphoserine phosphatase-like hydrolase [Stackebrandtia endophytica]|uniref:phosphoserine phosphatase n=1 Tax=Stackebrandtia endophytica TaxID=1496996 RepID=A0A543AZ76_9ACTN|nr:HAD-IB family phosphatase [Stackebrandtia endophytica]TQL77889.1 HAD superfamily phosphoserine phosphatase-like hydrolase [Stackebrandtia endophytica]
MPRLDDTAVFLDFDGTITLTDTAEHLLDRLATGDWREPGLRYRAGAISGLECLRREWAMLPHDEELLLKTAREVPLDPGTEQLITDLRAAGAEITVVSDGFGFHAEDECRRLGLPVVTARVIDGELTFPHRNTQCSCSGCGTCKLTPLMRARHRGLTTVVIGDGTSDRRAAGVADRVFAKNGLADWCARQAIPHTRFNRLIEVRDALLSP